MKVNDFKRDFVLVRSPYVQAKSIHTPRMHDFQIVHVFSVLRSKRNEKKVGQKLTWQVHSN